jgi:Leucine-rich repeat (LRR) protein
MLPVLEELNVSYNEITEMKEIKRLLNFTSLRKLIVKGNKLVVDVVDPDEINLLASLFLLFMFIYFLLFIL